MEITLIAVLLLGAMAMALQPGLLSLRPKAMGQEVLLITPKPITRASQGSSTPTRTRPKRKTGVERDTEKKKKTDKEKGFVIKESRSIADEIEAYFAEDNYMVILYNDPFNKRAYVSGVLQDVFKWDEMQADAVMLQAHNNGFAVAVETSQERAEDYVEKLLSKGLIAEARKSGDTGGEEGGEQ